MNEQAPDWHERDRDRTWLCAPPSEAAFAFHRALPDYAPTPLLDLPTLAVELGVGHLMAKNESRRLGLPAFKALGASWAVHRAVEALPDSGELTVVTATDGNHGRAVARFARLLGHGASIVVPPGVHPSAVQAIVDEGALVTEVDGSYDDAVAAAARLAEAPGAVLVQDTAWEGYEEIPGWIVDGYATLFTEIDEQLLAEGRHLPDLVIVPVGVGSLLQAALAHYRGDPARARATSVISVEPRAAACLPPSLAAGHPVTVETGDTVMSGLNCGTPSVLAWPYIERGLDAAVTISEEADITAAHDLDGLGVASGPCGAAGLAAARAVLTGTGARARREHLRIGPDSTVVTIITEGSNANPVPSLNV